MILDVHTHMWPGRHRADDHLAVLDGHGIDACVVLPIEPSLDERFFASTEWVVNQCTASPERLFPFCSLDPTRSDSEEVLECIFRELGVRGLKLHPPLQGFLMSDPRVVALLAAAADLGLVTLIHTGPVLTSKAPLIADDLIPIDAIAQKLPFAKLILAHANPISLAPFVAGRHDNVYLDTSVVWPIISKMIPGSGSAALSLISHGQNPGWSRLLFGSDMNPDQPGRIDAALTSVHDLALPSEHMEAVLGKTALQLLGIAPPSNSSTTPPP